VVALPVQLTVYDGDERREVEPGPHGDVVLRLKHAAPLVELRFGAPIQRTAPLGAPEVSPA
jgi:hypothetical protein